MIAKPLLQQILSQYCLPVNGLHGISHWARVLEIGQRLSAQTGADLTVVELFAIFHDSRRENEGTDREHGLRGAELAASLRGSLVRLPEADFERLHYACSHHTAGLIEADVTVQTCWDSDRLDLPRAQITPKTERLCTPAGRDADVRRWAEQRAIKGLTPGWVEQDWGIKIS